MAQYLPIFRCRPVRDWWTKKKDEVKVDAAVSAIGRLQSATYPYNTVALVKLPPPWELGNASAVQVGPFAYATAAHAVVNPANNRPFPGITVKPAFHVPSLASPTIRADAFVDPAYTYAANQVRGHDVAMQHAGAQPDAAIECGGKPGWQRARAITPDVVPPCFSGSGGICAEGFGYVRSSGWCRPLDSKVQSEAKAQERK